MAKQPLNVLSIDFDFFQHTTEEIMVSCYPDGHDFNTALSVCVWASHYANKYDAEKLKQVKPNKKLLRQLKNILQYNAYLNSACPNAITNSHRHIYDLIEQHYDKKKHNTINVWNIDMHHDMFDTTAETEYKNGKPVTTYKTHDVDCGNWATWVKKLCPSANITWICNDISEKLYPTPFVDKIEHDFSSILTQQFDIIFLCRSDVYSPPHLDKYFDDLRATIQNNFDATLLDPQITTPRDMVSHVEAMKKTYATIDDLRQKNKTAQ